MVCVNVFHVITFMHSRASRFKKNLDRSNCLLALPLGNAGRIYQSILQLLTLKFFAIASAGVLNSTLNVHARRFETFNGDGMVNHFSKTGDFFIYRYPYPLN